MTSCDFCGRPVPRDDCEQVGDVTLCSPECVDDWEQIDREGGWE